MRRVMDGWWVSGMVLVLGVLLGGGCASVSSLKPTAAPIPLRFDFVVGQEATYRLEQEHSKQVKWDGVPDVKKEVFRGGTSVTRMRLDYTQRVLDVDPNGNATMAVGIKTLVFYSKALDDLRYDFDSTDPNHAEQPLMGLIGKTYEVTISPTGQVISWDGLQALKSAVPRSNQTANALKQLFDTKQVRLRHSIAALDGDVPAEARVKDQWKVSTVQSFDRLGKKSFNKLYTLREVKSAAQGKRAVIVMEAEPSTRGLYSGNDPAPNVQSFDSTETYVGYASLDLNAGAVQKIEESLEVVWQMAGFKEPSAEDTEPLHATMTARQEYRLEAVDD